MHRARLRVWDLDAKRAYRSVAEPAGLDAMTPVVTAFTLAFDAPDQVRADPGVVAAYLGEPEAADG